MIPFVNAAWQVLLINVSLLLYDVIRLKHSLCDQSIIADLCCINPVIETKQLGRDTNNILPDYIRCEIKKL